MFKMFDITFFFTSLPGKGLMCLLYVHSTCQTTTTLILYFYKYWHLLYLAKFPFFSSSEIDRIIEAAGERPTRQLRQRLAFELNVATANFLGEFLASDFSSSDMAKKLKDVESTSKRLLDTLSDMEIQRTLRREAILQRGNKDKVYAAFESLSQLATLVSKVREDLRELRTLSSQARERKQMEAREDREYKPRHEGKIALQGLINDLAEEVWSKIFGRDIGTSVDSASGKAGGPLIRFITTCLQVIAEQFAPEIYYASLKELLSPTADAIRARLRNRNMVGSTPEQP